MTPGEMHACTHACSSMPLQAAVFATFAHIATTTLASAPPHTAHDIITL